MAQSLALVPVFTGTLNAQSVQLCDARALHAFMVVLRDFSTWIKGRIRKFGFVEGIDYLLTKSGEQVPHQGGVRKTIVTDYHLTLDMAKELAMVENNDKGREARRYFIDCEKQTVTRPMLVSTPFSVLPSQTLSAAQADTLRDLLADFAGSMPLDLRGLIMREGWSKLKSHFKTDYRHIPAAQFNEAISIVSRHIAKWAPCDPKKKELASADEQHAPSILGRRWVITLDHEGKEQVSMISANSAIVSPTEEKQVGNFINEMVPMAMLPKIIAMATRRMGDYIDHIAITQNIMTRNHSIAMT